MEGGRGVQGCEAACAQFYLKAANVLRATCTTFSFISLNVYINPIRWFIKCKNLLESQSKKINSESKQPFIATN